MRVERRAILDLGLTFYLIRKWRARDPDFKEKYDEIQVYICNTRKCIYCRHVGKREDFRTESESRKHWKTGICRPCESTRNIKKSKRSMEVKLNELLKRSRARRRPGGRNWPHENTLTLGYLVGLLEKQKGRCYFTGVELEYDTEDKSKLVSIDRLDPGKGYTEQNTALVSWLVNQVKRDLKEEDFISLCEKVVSFSRTDGIALSESKPALPS